MGGRTSCNHGPAGVARAGSKIDHVIGHRDNAHVQLRRDDRVARIDQRLQVRDETIRVGAVEPGRRLVQDVQRVSALRALQLGCELDTLRLTPGKLGCRLTQPEVVESDVRQSCQRSSDLLIAHEEQVRLLDAHRQHVSDRAPAPRDLER